MTRHIFYNNGKTAAMAHAEAILRRIGCRFASEPGPDVTHLLLDAPSFDASGALRGGGDIGALLPYFDKRITIVGGNLPDKLHDYHTIDLLQDDLYLAENADITAHCALTVALPNLPVTLKTCPVLVIGWGRIGKCLARLLRRLGADVTVAARKSSDRAMLTALGYHATTLSSPEKELPTYRIIFNTAPAPIFSKEILAQSAAKCLKIDLASIRGLEAEDVIWARGLPNTHAPETSGTLIAKTILRLMDEKEL